MTVLCGLRIKIFRVEHIPTWIQIHPQKITVCFQSIIVQVMSSETLKNAGDQASDVSDLINETLQAVNESFKATVQGQALAYSSLVFMAVIPILVGSYRSVKYLEEQQVKYVLLLGMGRVRNKSE